jgi:hypothetical protein
VRRLEARLLVTTYRIFPATNGPSVATAFSGSYIAGVVFEVTASGMWFQGYWWWCCGSGQATGPVECVLWSATGGTSGVIVPGSVVTSGTLVPGSWNFIPLASPVQLSIGSPYVAAVAQNGAFPLTNSQWGSGQPFASGIINGPLLAYSSTPDGATVNATPYFLNQNPFTTAGSDPATHFPGTGDAGANLWVDVQVSDTAPANYPGTYRVWPNKSDSSPTTQLDNATPFTLATEVRLAKACAANFVWFYSMSGAASLPTWAGVYPASGTPGVTAPVAANSSPSWLLPAGGAASAGSGWVKCAVTGTLPAGSYRVAVYNAGGAGGSWSVRDYAYWLTGPGASGITNGPVSSPANGSASSAWIYQPIPGASPPYTSGGATEPANGTFSLDNSLVTGAVQFPYLEVNYHLSGGAPAGAIAESFWVDLEVTPLAVGSGLLMASGVI